MYMVGHRDNSHMWAFSCKKRIQKHDGNMILFLGLKMTLKFDLKQGVSLIIQEASSVLTDKVHDKAHKLIPIGSCITQ